MRAHIENAIADILGVLLMSSSVILAGFGLIGN
jgi:hypothetical protein